MTAAEKNTAHRDTRRTIIATQCGDAYAAVVEHAAELRYTLGAGHDPNCNSATEARLVSVDHNRDQYQAVITEMAFATAEAYDGPPVDDHDDEQAEERYLRDLDTRLTAAQRRYEDAVTLTALRQAAELILTAPPLSKSPLTAQQLTRLHISRMALSIETDNTTN